MAKKNPSADRVDAATARFGGDHRFRWRYAALIFLLALLYRGAYLGEASARPDFNLFYMDQEVHLHWARCLLSGDWPPPYDQFRDAPYFRAPLYPYFLAAVLSVFGDSTLAVRIVQIVIGAAGCALAYGVAAKTFGQRVGLTTGALCACYWVLAYFDGELLLPVLLVPLALLGFLWLFMGVERRSLTLTALGGLAFGLFAITRPNILAFFPFAAWWTWRVWRQRQWRPRLIAAGLFALACGLPPLLATVRNGVVGGDWVLVASQGGVNFYIGNNPASDGMQAVVPGTRHTWWGGFEDTHAIAAEAAGRDLKPSEVSRYWYGRAFSYISEQPADWLRLTLRKAVALIGDVELVNNEPYEARRWNYWTFTLAPLSFALVFALFLVALPDMLRRTAPDAAPLAPRFASLLLQFALIYALTIVAFFVTGRYRVPLLPIVMMGAAIALTAVFDAIRARRMSAAFIRVAVAVALTLALRVDHFDTRAATRGFTALTEAQDLLDGGATDDAILQLERIRRERLVDAAAAYTTLINAYVKRNQPDDMKHIAEAAREGLTRYPDDPELLWYAALAEGGPGRERPFRAALDRYLQRRPDDIRALNLAFTVSLRLGESDRAADYCRRAAAAAPDDPRVLKMRRTLAGPR